jgi:hypothetical protein
MNKFPLAAKPIWGRNGLPVDAPKILLDFARLKTRIRRIIGLAEKSRGIDFGAAFYYNPNFRNELLEGAEQAIDKFSFLDKSKFKEFIKKHKPSYGKDRVDVVGILWTLNEIFK